ncbi:MAG: asparagine synthase-related protein, partial [Acidobacteriota bacterium]
RKKMGFPTPLKQWLLDPRANRFYALLRDPNRLLAAHLDCREIDRLIQRHQSGQEDGTDRLWNLLNLQIWGDLFLLGKQDEWQPSEAVLAPA